MWHLSFVLLTSTVSRADDQWFADHDRLLAELDDLSTRAAEQERARDTERAKASLTTSIAAMDREIARATASLARAQQGIDLRTAAEFDLKVAVDYAETEVQHASFDYDLAVAARDAALSRLEWALQKNIGLPSDGTPPDRPWPQLVPPPDQTMDAVMADLQSSAQALFGALRGADTTLAAAHVGRIGAIIEALPPNLGQNDLVRSAWTKILALDAEARARIDAVQEVHGTQVSAGARLAEAQRQLITGTRELGELRATVAQESDAVRDLTTARAILQARLAGLDSERPDEEWLARASALAEDWQTHADSLDYLHLPVDAIHRCETYVGAGLAAVVAGKPELAGTPLSTAAAAWQGTCAPVADRNTSWPPFAVAWAEAARVTYGKRWGEIEVPAGFQGTIDGRPYNPSVHGAAVAVPEGAHHVEWANGTDVVRWNIEVEAGERMGILLDRWAPTSILNSPTWHGARPILMSIRGGGPDWLENAEPWVGLAASAGYAGDHERHLALVGVQLHASPWAREGVRMLGLDLVGELRFAHRSFFLAAGQPRRVTGRAAAALRLDLLPLRFLTPFLRLGGTWEPGVSGGLWPGLGAHLRADNLFIDASLNVPLWWDHGRTGAGIEATVAAGWRWGIQKPAPPSGNLHLLEEP